MSRPFDCREFQEWEEYIAELEKLGKCLKKFNDMLTKE